MTWAETQPKGVGKLTQRSIPILHWKMNLEVLLYHKVVCSSYVLMIGPEALYFFQKSFPAKISEFWIG